MLLMKPPFIHVNARHAARLRHVTCAEIGLARLTYTHDAASACRHSRASCVMSRTPNGAHPLGCVVWLSVVQEHVHSVRGALVGALLCLCSRLTPARLRREVVRPATPLWLHTGALPGPQPL